MKKTPEKTLVFVYGTLRQGWRLHHLLEKQEYIGTCWTAPGYDLWADYYPWMDRADSTNKVLGEVYAVDAATLARLDRAEGHPSYYRRQPILLEEGTDIPGPVEAYLHRPNQGAVVLRVPSGDFGDHVAQHQADSDPRRYRFIAVSGDQRIVVEEAMCHGVVLEMVVAAAVHWPEKGVDSSRVLENFRRLRVGGAVESGPGPDKFIIERRPRRRWGSSRRRAGSRQSKRRGARSAWLGSTPGTPGFVRALRPGAS
jgi:gamma-glutamylcyclotransferase (GGCT)/AIG2-like uncharacterized protein YtfP